jgi:hypothetical protein
MRGAWEWVRRLLALLAPAVASLAIGACGGGHGQVTVSVPAIVSGFGQPASAADSNQVAALIERYYAAAAAEEGAKACGMLFFVLAESVAEKYHWAPGPRYLNGADSCQAVLTRVFERFHAVLRLRPAVTVVRVSGDRARALLRWSELPTGYVEARREGSAWKLSNLLAEPA